MSSFAPFSKLPTTRFAGKPSFTTFPTLSLAATSGLALGEALGRLVSTLTNTGDALSSPLANTAECLIRAFADLPDRLAGSLAHALHRALGTFADILDRLAGLADEMPSSLAHFFGRVTDAFEQLGVAIERGQYTLEDQADVVELRFQQSLGLDALDLQLHLAQPDIGTDADFHQFPHLCDDRHLGTQIVDLDVDFVHLDHGDVEENVRAVPKLMWIDDRVVGELLARTGPP